jgi:hypothetical protein
MFDNFVSAALAADAYLVYIYLCSEKLQNEMHRFIANKLLVPSTFVRG